MFSKILRRNSLRRNRVHINEIGAIAAQPRQGVNCDYRSGLAAHQGGAAGVFLDDRLRRVLPILMRPGEGRLPEDFVEKVEKSSATKTPQIAIRLNIAAQHHLRPVQDLVRCAIDKLAGPPADFLNAASVGLPENRTLPKGSFSTKSERSSRSVVAVGPSLHAPFATFEPAPLNSPVGRESRHWLNGLPPSD